METDKNELFVIKTCLIYLERLLTRYFMLDRKFIGMLKWVMADEMEQVANYLLENINDSQKIRLKEYLLECEEDPDEYPRVLVRFLRRSPKKVTSRLIQFISMLLAQSIKELSYRGHSDIEKNILSLKEMFHLTDQETEFCFFLFIISSYDNAEEYFIDYLEVHKPGGRKYLTTLLSMSQKELNDILRGTLAKIDFYEMDNHILRLEEDYLNFILNPSTDSLLKNLFTPITFNNVPLDYHFIKQEQIEYALELLKQKPETSTHILFYGPPGTGKTTFAKGLSKKLVIPAYEIARGEENTTKNRRAAILACLNMTNNAQGSLILVDEADNILNTRFSWFMRGETQDKGWLNQLLEEPGARIIWITNSICDIEKSVLRRFAFSLHFKPFSRRQRIQLWHSILRRNKVKRLISKTKIVDFAKRYKVSAGAIDIAVKKTIDVCPDSKEEFCKAISLALDSHEMLMNGGDKPKFKDMIEKNYSLDGLNIQGDLHAMINHLEKYDQYLRKSKTDRKINMNLLFYGPPGSGKSELARYIADHLDREIICKRASDILDPYVGIAEKNIKLAFEEAEAEEAVLIIDEVDSMLFSRDRAHRSWEISHTNEFLTQMERFKGVLICTTNRLKDLDQASIRRFNLKIGFDYLKPDGNVIFYQKFLAPLTTIALDEPTEETLRKMNNLAPGDFKVVRDKNSFHQPEDLDHQVFVQALKEEARIKKLHGGKASIGF